MTTQDYIGLIQKEFKGGRATEHSYRPALKQFVESLLTSIQATNEPKRQQCGAPDFIITKRNIPIAFIEAKDIGIDLNKEEKSNQMKRYLPSLENLCLTDYLEFRFFFKGQKESTVRIAKLENGKIIPLPEFGEQLVHQLTNFIKRQSITIKSSQTLAKMMAAKAVLLKDVLFNALTIAEDSASDDDKSLRSQLDAFRKILIHDMTEEQFADIYAQTITYGLFAARLHDETLDDFSRQEALTLIPNSNPFLRKLFTYISGVELDDRIVWIVDSLADLFRVVNIRELLADFGKTSGQTDPMIHFYETFLAEYNPKLRKSRGVYYTPEPVVKFIVRAVDDILKTEFGLKDGLADTSKITIQSVEQGKKISKDVHKVQILDPATGTGTFLAEIINQIHSKFKGMEGIWSSYVDEHLKPRLHGFEILMASYAMCHLKLDLLLQQTGYKPTGKSKRLNVFLTNSLEEADPDTGTLFASWLSNEAAEANAVKNDVPVMVVIGNPPYSVSSSNKGVWIHNLIKDYKVNLNEKNIQPLSDDYIKFIRYAEHYIEKNGQGIVAYISNNSFIDGIIHRQMRKHLLETFDKIYVLDLHGNSKKKETAPDGSSDENVFDIMQGVSINILLKKGNL
jgi:predicted helicase